MGAIGQATNKLGQLFVDIGVGGLGQTLKALNSVSATFLLTKNAATQAIKPFIDMGKEAANSAVGIGKMAAALGTTTINAQKLQYYLKQYKSEGLESDVAALQQMFTRIREGYGGVENQKAMSLGQLGLDWNKYSGSFEDTLRFIQDVKNALKTSGMTENEKVMHLQNLGLSNWKYLFEKEDFDINNALRISDKDFQTLQKATEQTEEIKNNIDQIKKNVTTNILENGGNNILEDLVTATGTNKDAKDRLKTKYGMATTKMLLSPLDMMFFNPFGMKGLFNKQTTEPLELINDASINAGSVESAALPSLPSVGDVNVSVTNNIKRDENGQPAFDYIDVDATSGGRDVEINAYTTHNNTGL